MPCRICGSNKIALEIRPREMMIPTREEFLYFECADCHCLQIKDIPGNLSDYYGDDYFSFKEPEELPASYTEKNMMPILDVGCGAGNFLKRLRSIGYHNLTGCDPYIPHDLSYGDEIKIYKKTIHEMDGSYGQIYLKDSFEHVFDPHEVMESVKRLLAPDGLCFIKIPVYPNIAFDTFGENWYQIDAPRHIFLHSVDSMKYLAEKHGLQINKIEYDSNPSQIFRSYMYSLDIPFFEQKMSDIVGFLGIDEVENIKQLSDEANASSYGDHAIFYLFHK